MKVFCVRLNGDKTKLKVRALIYPSLAKAKNSQVARAFRNCLHPHNYIPLLRTRTRYMAAAVRRIPPLDWIYMVYLASFYSVAINPGYLDVPSASGYYLFRHLVFNWVPFSTNIICRLDIGDNGSLLYRYLFCWVSIFLVTKACGVESTLVSTSFQYLSLQ